MPIHDWSRVDAGIFHHFHLGWIDQIARALNKSLPPDHYALAEQIAGGFGPDVLTLQRQDDGGNSGDMRGGVALEIRQPKVRVRQLGQEDVYARKAKSVVIRHTSTHKVIAVVEVVSPGNKSSRHGIRSIVDKSVSLIRGTIHLLILDLFAPGPRDPNGLHGLVWERFADDDYTQPADLPLTLAAYRSDRPPEAFVEPTAVGLPLIEMPVFLTPADWIPLVLEPTYEAAWESVPQYWREQITSAPRT